jgi:hypothetical protein
MHFLKVHVQISVVCEEFVIMLAINNRAYGWRTRFLGLWRLFVLTRLLDPFVNFYVSIQSFLVFVGLVTVGLRARVSIVRVLFLHMQP